MPPATREGSWLSRVAASAALVAILAAIGWQIVANTAADHDAATDLARALAWRPDSAAALTTLAEQAAAAADSDALANGEALARRALVANPLQERALRLLALTADARGDDARAAALMDLAAARTRRDPGVALWLLTRNIRMGDAEAAIANANVLLRSEPGYLDSLVPSFVAIASDSAGVAATIGMLARDPPWRQALLAALARDPDGVGVAYDLLASLAASGSPPRSTEIAPYLDARIRTGDYAGAFLAWLHFLPADTTASVPLAYNGDFERLMTGLPFDWTFGTVRGAVTEIIDTPDKGVGKALRVVFSDTRVPYRHATKLLLLPPGTYELSGMVKAESLTTARGMRWRLACADGDRRVLGESAAFAGTFDWRAFSTTFTVPDDGCPAQTLRLELDARVTLEQQVAGTFWTDDLIVTRRAPNAPAFAAAP